MANCCTRDNTWQTRAGWKGKLVSFRRLANWGVRPMSKNNSKDSAQPCKCLKEEFGEKFSIFIIFHSVQTFLWFLGGGETGCGQGILCSAWSYILHQGGALQFTSVQFNPVHSFVSNSLRPHGPQHARPCCLSPTTEAYSNSYPSSWWCHPSISSFSSHLQSFPVSESFPMRTQRYCYVYPLRENQDSDPIQFSHSVISDSVPPHGLQRTRPPCPKPIPRVYSNSCPFIWWCHPTTSYSAIPSSSCLQFYPASGFFHMSQFFASGGQSIGVSISASVLPMNIQDWFPLGLTGLILQSKGLARVCPNTTVQKHQFFGAQVSL